MIILHLDAIDNIISIKFNQARVKIMPGETSQELMSTSSTNRAPHRVYSNTRMSLKANAKQQISNILHLYVETNDSSQH